MNWLRKLFAKTTDQEATELNNATSALQSEDRHYPGIFQFDNIPFIRFGRYSDNNKTQQKTESWYLAEDRYKEKRYTEALEAFLHYLTDEQEQNVQWERDGDRFSFTLIQGSRKVRGEIADGVITAKSPLAIMTTPNTAAMRQLLEMNYSLYYCHCAMDEKHVLYMVFLSDIAATNPSKLYYGLRELATKADRQDDLLLTDFPTLQPTDFDHVHPLSSGELEVKYRYFRKWIEDTLETASTLNADSFSGAIAYLLLTSIYRIDFLILPQAALLKEIEKINGYYWDKKDTVTLVERNQMMKEALRKLLQLSKEHFSKSLFHSKSTFAIATPPKVDKVRDHVYSANKDSRWYKENKYPKIARTITEYGLVYNEYIYSMPQVQTDLIKIYMAVMHADFFRDLGMKTMLYDAAEDKLNKPLIEEAATKAVAAYTDKFKNIKWDNSKISFDSRYEFGIDFSEQLANLNLETKRD